MNRFSWDEPLFAWGCKYHKTIDSVRYQPNDATTFKDFEWLQESLVPEFKSELNLTKPDISRALKYFRVAQDYNDIVVNYLLYNMPMKKTLTYLQSQCMRLLPFISESYILTKQQRRLLISRNYAQAFEDIRDIVQNGPKKSTVPKYRIYTAHDYQTENAVIQIAPYYLFPNI